MKTYSGYIVKNATMDTIRSRMDASQASVVETARRLTVSYAALWAAEIADIGCFCFGGLQDESEDPLDTVTRNFTPEVHDVRTSITAFEDGNDIHVTINTKRLEIHDLLVSALDAQEFYYWDNLDRPDAINPDDWAARGKKWASLVGKDSNAKNGTVLSIDLPKDLRQFTAEQLVAAQPNLDTRIKSLVKNELVKQLLLDNTQRPKDLDKMTDFTIRSIERVNEEIRSITQHPQAMRIYMQTKTLIPAEITAEFITKPKLTQ